ncbi:MAG: S8 family peptidase [Bacteroidota bacterium]
MNRFIPLLVLALSLNPVFSQGNPAFFESKVEEVLSQYNLSGDGVVFAMLDRGIDYTHPAFLNEDGTTRIAYIFDMVDQTGANAPQNPYGVGTIFSEDEINTALENNIVLSTDRGGHGTSTTGIAVGNGGGTNNNEFKGVASKAKIIAVKLVLDAFPAFDGNAGQNGFYNPSYIPIALNFVEDKVAELGLPSVTLMNIGSIGGPTDGTSGISESIDNFIDNGHIFICGVGDDGGGNNHAGGNISQGESIELEINKALAGNLRFELWYSENDRFTVTIETPDMTQYGPFNAPADANSAVDQVLPSISFFHRGANQEFYNASSNRRSLLIDFSGQTGTYKLILEGTTVSSDGEFHATLNPSNLYSGNEFLTFIVPGTSINDFSASLKTISPGDYVSNNTWTDLNSIPRSRPANEGAIGEIWTGSSEGPTQDGRLGIDFVTPGEVIFAPYSPDTYYSSFNFNLVENGNNLYGVQTAVSASAPHTAGIIALMLEADPTLTNDEIKDILQQTARSDANTGTVPNATWGYGKIDALAAVEEVLNLLNIKSNSVINTVVFPNPSNDIIKIKALDKPKNITLYNSLGSQITIQLIDNETINVSNLSSGIYFLHLEQGQKKEVFKILKK